MIEQQERERAKEELQKQIIYDQTMETRKRIMYDFQGPEILNPFPLEENEGDFSPEVFLQRRKD